MNFDYLKYMTGEMDRKQVLHDLMTEFGDDVWNYAFLISKKREMADDITQDTFLKVFTKLHTFRGQSSVRTWLLTIARNTAFDYRKSSFMKKVTLVEYITEQKSHPSAEAEAMETLVSHELWEQVLRLPIKQREAIILYAHYQLKMQEVAELLDVSEGTIKSRIFKARMKLQQMREEREQYG